MKHVHVADTTFVRWVLIILDLVVNGNAVNAVISGSSEKTKMEKLLGFIILGLLGSGYLLVSCLEKI